MCGQYGYYGTSAFNLVLDMKEMELLDDAIVDTLDKKTEIERAFGLMEDQSDICSKSKIIIQNNISNIHSTNMGDCDDDYDAGF